VVSYGSCTSKVKRVKFSVTFKEGAGDVRMTSKLAEFRVNIGHRL